MNKSLAYLLKNLDSNQLEKECFLYYLNYQKISYKQSSLLVKYFNNFKPDKTLESQIKTLKLTDFKSLEHILEMIIPEKDRNLNGAFFTPEYIVDFIIDEIKPTSKDKVADLSCGCGAFLLGLIRHFQKSQKDLKHIVKHNIFGYDILDYNIRRAKILIAIYCLEQGFIVDESDFNLEQKDSLNSEFKIKFDHIVGNPPYVKFQDLSLANRKLLNKYQTAQKGNYNLYFAFFELAHNLIKQNGKIGFITPNNYFTSLAAEPLREYFKQTKSVYKIIDFNDQLIFEAQTYTCLTFLNKQKNESLLFDKLYSHNIIKFLENIKLTNIGYNSLKSDKWRLLRSADLLNIKKIETIGSSLKESLHINVGVATLKDHLFLVEEKISSKFYEKEYNSKKYKIENGILKDVFKISNFKNQEMIGQNHRKIIFPYLIKKGSVSAIPLKEIKTKYPQAYKYLMAIKTELDKRNADIDYFYEYGRSQGLKRFAPKLLTGTFSKYPNFLLVKESDNLYLNGYGLFIKDSKSLIFKEENIEVLQKVLNSGIMHYYLKHTSVSLQGGYPCYQKNFIERFTIPEMNQAEIDFIHKANKKEVDTFLIKKYQLQIDETNLWI